MKKLFRTATTMMLCMALMMSACTKEGPEGPKGSKGEKGEQGADGSQILSGTGAPATTLGKVGDFYFDTSARAFYGPKTAAGWGTPIVLSGTGIDGVDGADGSQILSGAGAPATTLGKAGDFYFDTSARAIYGPKTTTWGTAISLVGPQGPPGQSGEGVARIEVMTSSVNIAYDAIGQVKFRVNPSNAEVPTGSGDDIANWALDQIASLSKASYVTEPEGFELLSIEKDGNKDGQYIATIVNMDAAREYSMALVLNDGNGTLVSSSVFTVDGASIIAKDFTMSAGRNINVRGSGIALIDWGNGTKLAITLTAGGNNYTPPYTSGTYNIRISAANITGLTIYDGKITSLDVTKAPKLKYLSCNYNNLISLDLSNNPALEELYCNYNDLTILYTLNNPALKTLECDNNKLLALNVTKSTALTVLFCSGNNLSSLDVSKNILLKELDCADNQLTTLYVNSNPALTYLNFGSNNLTSINLYYNTALVSLMGYNNRLYSVSLTTSGVLFTKMEEINLSYNNLPQTNLTSILSRLPDRSVSPYTYNGYFACGENPGYAAFWTACGGTGVPNEDQAETKGWYIQYEY